MPLAVGEPFVETVAGAAGEIRQLHRDGDVDIDHVSGDLRIRSGDGHVHVTDANGAIDARW